LKVIVFVDENSKGEVIELPARPVAGDRIYGVCGRAVILVLSLRWSKLTNNEWVLQAKCQ
jgi:hypothetical protein